MRNYFFFLLAVALLTSGETYGQEKQITELLSQGRGKGKYYILDNRNGKSLKTEKVKVYAQEKNLLLGDCTLKDKGKYVEVLELLPKDEYVDYIFENLAMKNGVAPQKLSSKGNAYIYSPTLNGSEYFSKITNLLWSGEVVSGMIDGTGTGLAFLAVYNRPLQLGNDYTARVKTDYRNWHGNGEAATTYAPSVTIDNGGGVAKMSEYYVENTKNTGEKLYQVISGLPNGTYNVEVYANATYTYGRGFSSDLTDGAKDVCYVSANGVKSYIPTVKSLNITKNGIVSIKTEVVDGSLRIGLTAEKPGANWFTIQIKSLKRIDNSAKMTYSNENLAASEKPNLNDDHLMIFVSGTFKQGIPQGKVNISIYDNKGKLEPFKNGCLTNESTTVGNMSDGMASFVADGRFGFVSDQGIVAVAPNYSGVLQEFQNGKAAVMDKEMEVYIDKTGTVTGYTEHQQELIAAAEKQKQEEERQAKLKAEAERIKAEQLAEQKRIEEEKAEQMRLQAIKEDYAKKRNSVGKRITWQERISYNTSGGGLGGLLLGAVGLGTTDYDIEYTAIVESVIGDSSVKCIVSNARIISPSFASANWFKYKGVASEEMMKAVGQTRVKEFSEFQLAK